MTDVREWLDGRPVLPDDVAWALAVTGSLGCGWSVRIPYGAVDPSPVADAHRRAQQVADLFAAELDQAPWQELLTGPAPAGPLEVTGVWEPVFRGPLGTPRTRVVVHEATAPVDRTARAVALPWTYATSSATAGLPVLAVHEEAVVAAHLDEVAAGAAPVVGLWRDASGLLCTSTSGALLAYDGDRGWRHPGPARTPVGSWLHDQLVEALDSLPADLHLRDDGTVGDPSGRTGALSLWAVDARGQLTALGAVDPAADASLRTTRDRLLPGP